MSTVERTVTVPDGAIACIERRAGDGPTLVLCHATGFCKEVWLPVLDELEERIEGWRAVVIDQRFHGASQGFPADYHWWRLAEDVLAVIEPYGPVIGVGHSGGGAAIAMAEVSRPGSFSASILVEPIVLPPPYHVAPSHPLADAARRRTERFPSREAAFRNYFGKDPFTAWDDRVLRAYIEGGFRSDGEGVRLRCAPESEAQFFLHASDHGVWERLGDIEHEVLLIAGEASNSHPQPFLTRLAGRLPSVSTDVVPGASHFVPMEAPGLMADRIAGVIASVSGRESQN